MKHLIPGGRLAVISFHSGEDRRIRDLIEAEVNPCTCPPQFPMCVCGRVQSMRWVQKKPIRPSEDEVAANPRSRSSLLRIAEAVEPKAMRQPQ
jgi:16S rRNA (cytosine1402-N4)-methyltransferase